MVICKSEHQIVGESASIQDWRLSVRRQYVRGRVHGRVFGDQVGSTGLAVLAVERLGEHFELPGCLGAAIGWPVDYQKSSTKSRSCARHRLLADPNVATTFRADLLYCEKSTVQYV